MPDKYEAVRNLTFPVLDSALGIDLTKFRQAGILTSRAHRPVPALGEVIKLGKRLRSRTGDSGPSQRQDGRWTNVAPRTGSILDACS